MAKKTAKDTGLIYNGKPLVRDGKKLYYGNPEADYYVAITVNQSEMIGELEISTDLVVDLMKKDAEKQYKKEKSEKKESIYEAVELASKWLSQALGEDAQA